MLVGYFWQGYFGHLWWTSNYLISLLIPAVLVPAFGWIAFVPTHFEVNDDHLKIKFAFRANREIPWSMLKHWFKAEGVFVLDFSGSAAVQIFPGAYPKDQWGRFIEFIAVKFPERKAIGSVGVRGFRPKRP